MVLVTFITRYGIQVGARGSMDLVLHSTGILYIFHIFYLFIHSVLYCIILYYYYIS